jgi:hypothetical protein
MRRKQSVAGHVGPQLGPHTIAALAQHAKAERDFAESILGQEDIEELDPSLRQSLSDYVDGNLTQREEHLRSMFSTHFPDADMDDEIRKLESTGPEDTAETGERNLVDQGDIPTEYPKRKGRQVSALVEKKFLELCKTVSQATGRRVL